MTKTNSFFKQLWSIFDIRKTSVRLVELEQKVTSMSVNIENNQKIILELANAVACLSEDQALLISYLKMDAMDLLNPSTKKSSASTSVITILPDDDDFLN